RLDLSSSNRIPFHPSIEDWRPTRLYRPPPMPVAVLPLTVQLVSVAVPLLARPPPLALAELPLMVQLVSVAVPRLYRPPPTNALPPVIVSPERDAVTPPSIWNTRLALLPLIVTPAAGPVIVSVPLVLLSSSWVPVRVIVCGEANTVGSKVMVEIPAESKLAKAMASRRLKRPAPGKRASLVVFTTRLGRVGPALVRANETGDAPVPDAPT